MIQHLIFLPFLTPDNWQGTNRNTYLNSSKASVLQGYSMPYLLVKGLCVHVQAFSFKQVPPTCPLHFHSCSTNTIPSLCSPSLINSTWVLWLAFFIAMQLQQTTPPADPASPYSHPNTSSHKTVSRASCAFSWTSFFCLFSPITLC